MPIDDLTGCPVRFICEFGEPTSRVMVQLLVNEGNDVVLVPALTASDQKSAMHAADYLNVFLAGPISYEEVPAASWNKLAAQKFPGVDSIAFAAATRYALAGAWPVQPAQLPPTKGPIGRTSQLPGRAGRETTFIRLKSSAVLEVFNEQRLIDAAFAAGWKPMPGDDVQLASRAAAWIARNIMQQTFPGAASRTSTSAAEPGTANDVGPGFSMTW